METQPTNRSTQETQPKKATESQVTPQPWVKPTFERVPLNDALAPFTGRGNGEFNHYAS